MEDKYSIKNLIIIFVIKHLVFKRIFDKRFIVLLVPLIIVNLFSAYVINHKIINTVYYFIYLVFAYFIAKQRLFICFN